MTLPQRIRRWLEDHRLVTFKYLCERTEQARTDERKRWQQHYRWRVEASDKLWLAADAFLAEYEAYRAGDAVSFVPDPEVYKAFREAVRG